MTRTYAPPAAPPTSSSIMLRQILSIPVCLLLWTAAMPFAPIAWIIGHNEGAYLVDRFVAGLILLCALYFQWKLSTLSHPIAITFPNPLAEKSETYIQNGKVPVRVERENTDIVFMYHPSNYFVYTAVEVALLLVAEFGGMEYVRRGVVAGVLSALWAIGWRITPRATKDWAWGHIKFFWTVIVLDIIRDVAFGGGRRRSRR